MKNNNSSLSYSSFNLLSMSGKKIFTKEKSIYQNSKNTIFNSYFVNTIKYIIYRNPVPIVFGVFKTKNFSQLTDFFTYGLSAMNMPGFIRSPLLKSDVA